ncbi:MAG TPA: hypothetical protein VJ850_08450 [Candidatus Limnocylindrales bacterium]|nr:hypothetical protein [Candidatus Limnocylindrales bacterium]
MIGHEMRRVAFGIPKDEAVRRLLDLKASPHLAERYGRRNSTGVTRMIGPST